MRSKLYERKLSFDEYYAQWTEDKLKDLTPDIKNAVYEKYCAKYEVYTRDNFKCQNVHCKYPASPLTIHHIKAQRNGGDDKPRNMITLCDTCHKGYERAKHPITFSNEMHIPSHIRGHTFKLSNPMDDWDWKKVRKQLKKKRKVWKCHSRRLSLPELFELLYWLGYI
jgi:hypothetical protein